MEINNTKDDDNKFINIYGKANMDKIMLMSKNKQ